MKKEKYICNGQSFASYGEAEKYAKSIGMRIANTEKIRGCHLLTLSQA